MSLDLSALLDDSKPARLLIEASLIPVQGKRFQPTGFPDLGAAVFDTKDGTRLIVESHQSMANRLEAVCWDHANRSLVSELQGLSHVLVNDSDGNYLTSTITEAHRLNSPYILESKDRRFFEQFRKETEVLEKGRLDRAKLAAILFKYDVGSLLHGIFLAKKELVGGRLRIERALSAFIEAEGARVAASGGVKNDHVDPKGGDKTEKGAKEGFGNVPFQRDEYTADRIVAYFNLDLVEVRGFGLGKDAEALLIALALYKIRAFIEGNLRLRTACDFEVDGELRVRRPAGFAVPSFAGLRKEMPRLIAKCARAFAGERGATTVTYKA
ncbi:type I-U CRISPR-associated RAMP protein Csb1/Cas7u [Pendulispora rubella]|uniref:Type I-U CRISPR-associated RAMP protein Csb1/Cas7u n=1 Tax=Pendulispora rubella TaxID=2741070 RepID=A0ABZ2LJN5_9BACT